MRSAPAPACRVVERARREQVGADDHREPGCTSRIISIASGSRGIAAAMNPTVTGRPSRCPSRRAVSKHSRTARGSLDPAAASTTASPSARPSGVEALGEHRDDAVVGAELSGEPRAAADAVEPERQARAHVEARGEHERHDDRIGLGVGGERRRDIRVRGVDEADRDVELGSLGRDAVDEPDHGFAVLRPRARRGSRRRGGAGVRRDFRRQRRHRRPDHLPTPRSPAESGLAAGFDAMHGVFRGRHPRVSGT